jgi:hypothetical protein
MVKQERQLICNMDGSATYWQNRNNSAEYQREQPLKQESQSADDSWILLFGILGTLVFLVFLVKETI